MRRVLLWLAAVNALGALAAVAVVQLTHDQPPALWLGQPVVTAGRGVAEVAYRVDAVPVPVPVPGTPSCSRPRCR